MYKMNKKNFLAITIILITLSGLALAAPGNSNGPQNDRGPLEKISFIHYKDSNAKPPWAGGGKNNTKSTCYSFLAKDAKWKQTENYYINPANLEGLSEADVVNATNTSINTWDSEVSFNIFGTGLVDYSVSYNNGDLDGINTVSFGSISDPNVIGVTTIWGYFSGKPSNRELIEWDMLLDQDDFDWGNNDPNKMDLENLLTHELGHAAGLGDLYDAGCTSETMYGYSTEGETSKRTLEAGDIEGITKLYK